jgi:ABC-type nitrate/sulfonate/bicarbonate transport system substrate-binding protein
MVPSVLICDTQQRKSNQPHELEDVMRANTSSGAQRTHLSLAVTRRRFCASFAAGVGLSILPNLGRASEKMAIAATGLDTYYVPFAIAADKKIFEKYGLDFTYKPFDDGSAALDAVITNSADMGGSNQVGGLTRWDHGGRLYAVATLDSSDTLHGLCVRGGINKPEDLIGKTIAYPKFTSGHYLFYYYTNKYKLPSDKIKVKVVPAPETVAAMARGDIDAFFLWEPWPTKAMQLVPGAHMLMWAKDEGLDFPVYIYYSQGLVKDEERALAVTRALIDATDFCAAHPEEAAKSAAKAFRLPEAEARGYVDKLKFRVQFPKERTITDFDTAADFCTKVGLIKQKPNYDDFIRPQFIKAVAPARAPGW